MEQVPLPREQSSPSSRTGLCLRSRHALALSKEQISHRSLRAQEKVALPAQNPKLCLSGAVQMFILPTMGLKQD